MNQRLFSKLIKAAVKPPSFVALVPRLARALFLQRVAGPGPWPVFLDVPRDALGRVAGDPAVVTAGGRVVCLVRPDRVLIPGEDYRADAEGKFLGWFDC